MRPLYCNLAIGAGRESERATFQGLERSRAPETCLWVCASVCERRQRRTTDQIDFLRFEEHMTRERDVCVCTLVVRRGPEVTAAAAAGAPRHDTVTRKHTQVGRGQCLGARAAASAPVLRASRCDADSPMRIQSLSTPFPTRASQTRPRRASPITDPRVRTHPARNAQTPKAKRDASDDELEQLAIGRPRHDAQGDRGPLLAAQQGAHTRSLC